MSLRETLAGGWAGLRRHLRGAASTSTRWIVLDVESTGLDPARDRLLAIAALAVHVSAASDERPRIELADSFDAVLHHEIAGAVPADKANILVHGIGVGAMRAGQVPARVLRAFAEWAGAAPRLGFNVAFDRTMIERAEREHLGRCTPAQWLDIEALAAVAHPEVKARALDEWLARFAIPCARRHQAIADALATAELLLRLWPRLQREAGGEALNPAFLARLAAARRWV
ncbi:MAG: 3'-5' exonuclease [Burkholderiales bacterium]|nr:3'-5' exonuclease [Burkholderiales bacterium]